VRQMTKMNLRCDLAKDICAQSLLVAQTMTSSNLNFYISHGNMKDPASSFFGCSFRIFKHHDWFGDSESRRWLASFDPNGAIQPDSVELVVSSCSNRRQ
jgi:hypothetical protein